MSKLIRPIQIFLCAGSLAIISHAQCNSELAVEAAEMPQPAVPGATATVTTATSATNSTTPTAGTLSTGAAINTTIQQEPSALPKVPGSAATSVEIVALLRNARVVAADYPLRASLNGHEAIVTTKRNPAAKDKDCKIDAVMMSKTLMEAIPELLRVKVLFADYEQQKYTEVSLSKGDIASYAAGKLGQNDFLDSLEISTFKENVSPFAARGGEGTSTGVVAGPLQDKRLLLLSRIESLRQKGTNVKTYLEFFQTIEDAAKAGDESKVLALISKLSGDLNDQEKMREQAYATGVQQEVLRFQTQLQRYVVTGRKLPFDLAQVAKIQQLVVAGRNAEAKSLMQTLEQKLR